MTPLYNKMVFSRPLYENDIFQFQTPIQQNGIFETPYSKQWHFRAPPSIHKMAFSRPPVQKRHFRDPLPYTKNGPENGIKKQQTVYETILKIRRKQLYGANFQHVSAVKDNYSCKSI